jgi:hypothetical protein
LRAKSPDFPILRGYGQADIDNPNDMVQEGTSESSKVLEDLCRTSSSIALLASGLFYEKFATYRPVLTLAEALEGMQEVEDSADEIQEAKHKRSILISISRILIVIAFVGGVTVSVWRASPLQRGL